MRGLWLEVHLVGVTEDEGVQRVRLPDVSIGDVESLAALHDVIELWTIS
jgi:hypothetical protein